MGLLPWSCHFSFSPTCSISFFPVLSSLCICHCTSTKIIAPHLLPFSRKLPNCNNKPSTDPLLLLPRNKWVTVTCEHGGITVCHEKRIMVFAGTSINNWSHHSSSWKYKLRKDFVIQNILKSFFILPLNCKYRQYWVFESSFCLLRWYNKS